MVAEEVAVPPTWRVTVTPPFVNKARSVLFLVAGSKKAATLAAVLEGLVDLEALPRSASLRAAALDGGPSGRPAAGWANAWLAPHLDVPVRNCAARPSRPQR